jgi:hypothetical protein
MSLPIVLLFSFSAFAAPIGQLDDHSLVFLKNGVSSNWAGYAAVTNLSSPRSGAVTDVQGSWTVPAVDCSSGKDTYSSYWVGIDGYASTSVEQVGTAAECRSGQPRYYAWYEMYPQSPTNLRLQIKPGDLMFGEIKYAGRGMFLMTIADKTTGQNYTTMQFGPRAKRTSAEWIAEAPVSQSGVLPLADFGTAKFQDSQATINGVTGAIDDSHWQSDIIAMKDKTGLTKAITSPLSGGSAFTVTWQHE